MTLLQKQLIIWAVSALTITVASIWVGESPADLGGRYFALLMGIPIIIALMFVLNLAIKQKWFVHFSVGFVFLILLVVSFSIGSTSYQDAFNDCVEQGEGVRVALQKYYQKNKMYPKSLSDLTINLPGQLILHPNILQYEPTKQGYLLRFSDNFIAFEATELLPFEAQK